MKLIWISSWDRVCGIADYSKVLWSEIQRQLSGEDWDLSLVSLDDFPPGKMLVKNIIESKPDIIHFQHEYSLYGGKTPGFYLFPGIVSQVKAALPQVKIVATAHSVIPRDYSYPVKEKPILQRPARIFANRLLLSHLKKLWSERTWGPLNLVITHSESLKPILLDSNVKKVVTIPVFVQTFACRAEKRRDPSRPKRILVFGFFTPDKGQDIAIKMVAALRKIEPCLSVKLVLGGGVRTNSYESFYEQCIALVKSLNLEKDVEITGYLGSDQLSHLFDSSEIVLAPFRSSSGSASLSAALGRGAAILASNLPLIREILSVEADCLETFDVGDIEGGARKLGELILDPERLETLRAGALRYANKLSPVEIARRHVQLYKELQ
jgi:glycosyltransferase involved in cell wall biosynthesis